MTRHSPETERIVQGLTNFFEKHPQIAESMQEQASDPESFYNFNNSMNRGEARILLRRRFDDDAIVERCHAVTTEVFDNRQTLVTGIDDKVQTLDDQSRLSMFETLSDAIRKPKYTHPASVKSFLSGSLLGNASKQYEGSRDEAYQEIFFWCQETGSLDKLISFISLLEDPKLARMLLGRFAEREKHFYGLSTDIDDTMRSEYWHNAGVRNTKKLLKTYATESNNRRLKNKLRGENSLVKHVFIGALALANIGVSREEARIYRKLAGIAKQPPLTAQLLHDSLHAHLSTV